MSLPEPYYEDEYATIYHADCREILPRLEKQSIDLCLTDPPYSSGGMYRADRTKPTDAKYQHTHETTRVYPQFAGDNRDQRSFEKWCTMWMADVLQVVREGGVIGCFIDWRNITCVIDAVQMGGWVYRVSCLGIRGPTKGPAKRGSDLMLNTSSSGPLDRWTLVRGRMAGARTASSCIA